ncbi:MAG: porin, partial [Specibacter sp.]
ARATSVVFLAESWAAGQLWLFWLAPLFGAALAAAIFRSFAPAVSLVEADLAHDAVAPAATIAAGDSAAAVATDADQLSRPVPASGKESAGSGSAAIDDARAFFDGPKK